ncbi:hypothetical protein B566_EDAN007525 [Ephemera danica]|nr:hypothetical protein B566_EDAN007525 [Ephemera danica]
MVSTSPEPPRLNGAPCCDGHQTPEGHTSSDSEDEQPTPYEGYELLPQQFEDEESAVNHENNSTPGETANPLEAGCDTAPVIHDPMRDERLQLWSGPGGRDVVQMDAARTQQVLQAMAGFSLPSSAVPAWASSVPEEQWRAKLDERLQTMHLPPTSPTDPPDV